MQEQPHRSYFAVIPANIRYDKRIPANAKLLYGEITALCTEKGFCWASNAYFAELYGVSTTSISQWISKMEKAQYITTELVYKPGTKEILHRYIKLFNDPPQENLIDNTTPNNTAEIQSPKGDCSGHKPLFGDGAKENEKPTLQSLINEFTSNTAVKKALQEYLAMRKQKRDNPTIISFQKMLAILGQASKSPSKLIEIIEKSTRGGYRDFYTTSGTNNAGAPDNMRKYNKGVVKREKAGQTF